MGRPAKVAIIGAGSAVFSLGLVRDLCMTDDFSDSEVVLMDIDEGRVDTMHRLARRYGEELGSGPRFSATTNRKEALTDADIVVNTAAPAHDDHELQRKTFEQHGYYRGFPLPYRNFEIMLDVAHDIETFCPDAWLLQVGNPVFDGCTLMARLTNVKLIGLCHGHLRYRDIARTLGLDPDEFTSEAPGVNHCIWMTSFRYRGEDAYPLIDRWITEEAEQYWSTYRPIYSDNQMSRAAVEMYRMYGLFPIGDTARQGGSRYISDWWYHADPATKRHFYGPLGGFDSEDGWNAYLDKLSTRVDHIFRVARDDSCSVTEEFPPEMSKEQHVPVMNALLNDRQGIFQVNIINNGAISGIADDVVVEGPGLVTAAGPQLLRQKPLPPGVLNRALMPKILEMELNLETFQSGDPRVLIHQLLFDHRTGSVEQAVRALDAVLQLPFNASLRARFGDVTSAIDRPR